MELCTKRLADRGRDRRQFLRELEERVAQTIAQVRPREQRPPTFDRAVEAIGQDARTRYAGSCCNAARWNA